MGGGPGGLQGLAGFHEFDLFDSVGGEDGDGLAFQRLVGHAYQRGGWGGWGRDGGLKGGSWGVERDLSRVWVAGHEKSLSVGRGRDPP
ncbi:hypothetical protein GCM10008937_24420 [Deinococcus depolymerans]|uniref:Uncharacterized protein n=1 Tax=Deinococcus depolymerans TaxID=392408 RepID=A0ABN1CBM2_9DEIO